MVTEDSERQDPGLAAGGVIEGAARRQRAGVKTDRLASSSEQTREDSDGTRAYSRGRRHWSRNTISACGFWEQRSLPDGSGSKIIVLCTDMALYCTMTQRAVVVPSHVPRPY